MIGIKYISPADNSGYGVAAKAYLKGLMRYGVAVTWTPLVKGKSLVLGYEPLEGSVTDDEMLTSICHSQIPYDTVIFHMVPEYIPHFISQEPGKRWIAHTAWETDIIPPHWPELLEQCHCILTPSHFSREAFVRGGIAKPVHVIPHIATEQGASSTERFQWIDPGCFVFYTIAEWIPRKACDLTVMAYLSAFRASDNCVLIVKTGRYDKSLPRWRKPFQTVRRQISRMASHYKQQARIELIDGNIPEEQIHALHRRGDCFVSLTRGEGWGLGSFEAATTGNPVVITGYGGQTEYLPADYPYLVRHTLVHVKPNRRWSSYGADQSWAEPDIEDAVRLMRHLSAHPRKAKWIGEKLRAVIDDHYRENAVVGKLLELLVRI